MMVIGRALYRDAASNLALEQRLLRCDEEYLMFYINSPAVVVGRNQSIEAEANVPYCVDNGIALVRRISGGGAVWHDPGNINYSFITSRTSVNLLDSDPLRPIIDALTFMGVSTTIGVRNDILVDGKKISGTASYVGSMRQIFHGTLLHDSDLDLMQLALSGNHALRGNSIASVPSPVVNLRGYVGGSTLDFLERLERFFETYYGFKTFSSTIFE